METANRQHVETDEKAGPAGATALLNERERQATAEVAETEAKSSPAPAPHARAHDADQDEVVTTDSPSKIAMEPHGVRVLLSRWRKPLLQPIMSSATVSLTAGPRNSINPWFVAAAVVIPTLIGSVDTTIVGVARPYISGSLSAPAVGEWVMTGGDCKLGAGVPSCL